MEHVILFRNQVGKIMAIQDDEEHLTVFPNFDAALKEAENHPFIASLDYQIVELNEL